MTITKNQNQSQLTVAVEGRLDTVTAPQLEGELKSSLNGITALATSAEDYVAAARILSKFAEKHDNFKLKKDPRVTPLGRFLRKTSIDEFPQLINIFKGEMTIVGPRPERPEIAAEYEKTLPEFRLRLQAKAGLTGYAQVYGKYNTTPYDKLLMDLMYISCASMFMDLRICIETLRILFDKQSTEGMGEEEVVLTYNERKDEKGNKESNT